MSRLFSLPTWFTSRWRKEWPWLRLLFVLLCALQMTVAWVSGSFGAEFWATGLALGGLCFAEIIGRRIFGPVDDLRYSGWRVLGPHFYYDVIRLARRGRSTMVRGVYILALFVGLAVVYGGAPATRGWSPNEFARVSEHFAYSLFVVQNLAIMILTPAYLGSAIAEERERGTLDLLFTTQMTNTEMILGKLLSRVIHLAGLVLAGVPILSLIQFWGGVDVILMAGNLVNTLLNILSLGSICLFVSVLCRSATRAVMTSYALILPAGFCCLGTLRGFPFVLQDARTGGLSHVSVQDLGLLCVLHGVVVVSFLFMAIATLRSHQSLGKVTLPEPWRLDTTPGTAVSETLRPDPVADAPAPSLEPSREKRYSDADFELSMAYTLPPVSDSPLLWKERFLGGPPWILSRVILIPALPFLVAFMFFFVSLFVDAMFLGREVRERFAEVLGIVLRFLYYPCLAAYTLGVGFRTAASVARERQQQTLEPLLMLPIDRSEILLAKLLGSLWRGWPWLALIAGNIVLGTLMGAYHPFSAVILCVAPWALIFFIAGLGLMLSVVMGTVMRANLVLLTVMILMAASTFMSLGAVGPLTYMGPFVYPLWQNGPDPRERFPDVFVSMWVFAAITLAAAVCLTMAFRRFNDRSRATEA